MSAILAPSLRDRAMVVPAAILGTWLVGGCYVDMPLGTLGRAASDADSDVDSDVDGGPDSGPYVCEELPGCRVTPDPDLERETLGAPIPLDGVLHERTWTFTSLQVDASDRMYAFFWWVPSTEFDDPQVQVEHLAWRTRTPDEEEWSEVRAVPGVTSAQREAALCSTPSQGPIRFATTDDGYVHAFWRKNEACRGVGIWHVEHAIFEDGGIVFREEMPIDCNRGTELWMTDAIGLPGGVVTVAFLCGYAGRLQTYSCGCWEESESIGGDGVVDVQDDLRLVLQDGEMWIVVRSLDNDLWARRLADAPGEFLQVSDERSAVGSPEVIPDGDGGPWVVWQSGSVPSDGLRVTHRVDGVFDAPTTLESEPEVVQLFSTAWVPGRGPLVLANESAVDPVGEKDGIHVLRDWFTARTHADGAWSEPVLVASSEIEFEGRLARHTACDVAVVGDRAHLAYVTYVGGDTRFALRVVEVP